MGWRSWSGLGQWGGCQRSPVGHVLRQAPWILGRNREKRPMKLLGLVGVWKEVGKESVGGFQADVKAALFS